MTNLELRSVKDAVDFWWEMEGRHDSYDKDNLPVFVATLLGYIHRMDGSTFNLEDGTWKYPSGVQV